MSCNWCLNEEVARALIVALCSEHNEIWKEETNPDLCFCLPCVREYHRLKDDYINNHPQHEKTLYEIEVERIKNHFLKTRIPRGSESDEADQSNFPCDIEEYLKVPLAEVLQYPYLLFNNELMDSFLSCLLLLIKHKQFGELEEKYPGIYLLLINPCSQVRLWALATTKQLGAISLEDFPHISPVINCLLRIALFGLLDSDLEVEQWPFPKVAISEETYPLPHLYYPLSKRDFWLALCSVFQALECNVLRMLLNSGGNSQLLEIMKVMMQKEDAESNSCFWCLVLILNILMKKLGSTFWLLVNFGDSPQTLFKLIVQHKIFTTELESIKLPDEESHDLVAHCSDEDHNGNTIYNILVHEYYQGIDELPSVFGFNARRDPFFWIIPFVATVLDLEEIANKVLDAILLYLLSIANESKRFADSTTTHALKFYSLNCLCNVLKYLINKRLACFIKDTASSWFDALCAALFGKKEEDFHDGSKKSNVIWKKAQCIILAITMQAESKRTETYHSYRGLSNWLRDLNPSVFVDTRKVKELRESFSDAISSIADISLSELGTFHLDEEPRNLFSFYSGDESCNAATETAFFESLASKRETLVEAKVFNKRGSSLDPIMLDSDSESDFTDTTAPKSNYLTNSSGKVILDPISYDEDLDYSEDLEDSFEEHTSDDQRLSSVTKAPTAKRIIQYEILDSEENESDGHLAERVGSASSQISDHVNLDCDSGNVSGLEIARKGMPKKRKHSAMEEASKEVSGEQNSCNQPFHDTAFDQKRQKFEQNNATVAVAERAWQNHSENCTSKSPDNVAKFPLPKVAGDETSPFEKSERGIFDFLDKIKEGTKKENHTSNDFLKQTDDTSKSEYSGLEVARRAANEGISAIENDANVMPESNENKISSADIDKKLEESAKVAQENIDINEVMVDYQEINSNVGFSDKRYQRNKILLYEQFVKKKELLSLLKDGEEKNNTATVAICQKPGIDENESTRNIPAASDLSNVQQKSTTEHESLPQVLKHKLYNANSLLQYILSWQPMWLENEQEDELQIMLPCEPRMVKAKYGSYDEYMQTMWPLILIEFFAQVIKDFKASENPVFQCKIRSYNQDSESQTFKYLNCICLQERDMIKKNCRDPAVDDLVILRCADEYTTEIFGVIEDVEKTPMRDDNDPQGKYSYTLMSLRIKISNLQPGSNITSVQLQIVTKLIPLFRKWEALIRLPKSLLAGDILNPFRPQVFEARPDGSSVMHDKYNASQSKAIDTITEAAVQAFPLPKLRLLQGPPGTGKTYTLLGLIKSILMILSKKEKARILLCAPSNAAVDEIAYRLLQDPPKQPQSNKDAAKKKHGYTNCGGFNLLRIGSASQINHRIGKCSLDYLVDSEMSKLKLFSNPEAIREEIKKILQNLKELDKICTKLKMSRDKSKHAELKKRMFERERGQKRYEDLQKRVKMAGPKRDLREEESRLRTHFLTRADIICCTLSGAGNKHMINTFKTEWNGRNLAPFDCVVIDEAGQCCEPEALIPLQYGSSKLVLVGDPAQLPATVFSKRAFRYGYGQSLFERIYTSLAVNCATPVLMLEEQYRMHPGICAFPSQKFYEGHLITAREVLQRKMLAGVKPFVVLDIYNSREEIESKGNIHNPEERRYVIDIINRIRQKGIIPMDKIGVITPYRKQIEKLKEEVTERQGMKGIEINTIDGFQGREKDVIILSCVRAQGGESGIGFLRDPQRLNVALTRAKHSLIVLLHSDSLKVDEDWKDLIDFACSRGLLFPVRSFSDIGVAVFETSQINSENLHVQENHEGNEERKNQEINPLRYEDLSDDEGDKDSKPKLGKKESIEKDMNLKQKLIEKDMDLKKVDENKLRMDNVKNSSTAAETSHDDRNSKLKISKTDQEVTNGKGTIQRIRQKFPHCHSDGQTCVTKCIKSGERATPSQAYYKLPHIHSDGLRCTDKCIRVEEREKRRKMLKAAAKNGVSKSILDTGKDQLLKYGKSAEPVSSSLINSSNDIKGDFKSSAREDESSSGTLEASPRIGSTVSSKTNPSLSSNSTIHESKFDHQEIEVTSGPKLKDCSEHDFDTQCPIFPPLPLEKKVLISKENCIPKPPTESLDTSTSLIPHETNIMASGNSPRSSKLVSEDMEISDGSDSDEIHLEVAHREDPNLNAQNGSFFLNEVYQPKVLLSNCLIRDNTGTRNATRQTETGRFLLQDQPVGYGSYVLNSSSVMPLNAQGNINQSEVIQGGIDQSMDQYYYNANGDPNALIGTHIKKQYTANASCSSQNSQFLFPEYHSTSPNISLSSASPQVLDSRSPSLPTPPVSPMCIGDEIHKIRLSTNSWSNDQHLQKQDLGGEETSENSRYDDVHPERRRIIHRNSKERRSLVLNINRKKDMNNNRLHSSGNDPKYQEVHPSNSTDNQSFGGRENSHTYFRKEDFKDKAPQVNGGKITRRLVRAGVLSGSSRGRYGASKSTEHLESAFEIRDNTAQEIDHNKHLCVSMNSNSRYAGNHQQRDSLFSSHSRAEPLSLCYQNTNGNRLNNRKTRRTVSTPSARQNNVDVSKMDEITQRIRERNESRNKRTQLLSSNDEVTRHQRSGRSRIVRR